MKREVILLENHEVIEGLITDIIYYNEENGYAVCEVEIDEERSVCVGSLPGISAGENIKAVGTWKTHPTYGDQFSIVTYEKQMPKTKKSIEKYLASGIIKGIGPTIAKRIVKKFEDKTIEILEKEPERLEEVKGISLSKAQKIGETFQAQSELRNVMLFLQDYGISPTYALKIYKKYKARTIDIIKTNPYRLADDIHGIGFKKADIIADMIGISRESEHRIKSAIKYILMQSSQNGNTFLYKDKLYDLVSKLVNVEVELIDNALLELQMNKEIFQDNKSEAIRVYLAVFYYAELNVARKLLDIAAVKIKDDDKKINNTIDEIQKSQDLQLAKNQRLALKEAATKGVLVVTGGPGTGKTTTINSIIYLLEQQGNEILLAAPTGRAAKRMSEATDREAYTIHRLLENNFLSEDTTSQMFERNEENPLEADVVIIDEVSMVDILLMNSLLKAIMPGTRLILVGDVDQLPSVGPGNVLKDLIESECLDVVVLDEIFRQAQESAIVMNAHRINTGRYPVMNEKNKDFFFIKRIAHESVIETVIDLIKTRLPKFYNCSPIEDIQVLTPMRKSILGVDSLNKELQDALNPKSSRKREKEYRESLFREGDKVMQIKNNYNIAWKILNKYDYPIDEGLGVFNGDVGKVKEIDNRNEKLTVIFDDKKIVEYDYSNLDELQLAYAITIHKSQGSEHPIVILPIHSGPHMLLSRNLLYTAVTRAKKYVVIVGIEETVRKMVDNKREINRCSSLDERINECKDLMI